LLIEILIFVYLLILRSMKIDRKIYVYHHELRLVGKIKIFTMKITYFKDSENFEAVLEVRARRV